jgi:hypothetical protein
VQKLPHVRGVEVQDIFMLIGVCIPDREFDMPRMPWQVIIDPCLRYEAIAVKGGWIEV